jgi:hypothetical protein
VFSGRGDVPLVRIIVAGQFAQRVDREATRRVDGEAKSGLEWFWLVHGVDLRRVSALQRNSVESIITVA